jgi:hypothetical protein
MAKKQLVLIGVAVILFGVYACYFSGWFTPKQIFIQHSLRVGVPPRGAMGRIEKVDDKMNVMTFAFNGKFDLTEVKVVALAEIQTNKYAHPLWHVVTESNSVPMKAIVYGMRIRGMQPKVKGAEADPLDANVAYRLIVDAGKVHGEHDFTPISPVTPVQRSKQQQPKQKQKQK